MPEEIRFEIPGESMKGRVGYSSSTELYFQNAEAPTMSSEASQFFAQEGMGSEMRLRGFAGRGWNGVQSIAIHLVSHLPD